MRMPLVLQPGESTSAGQPQDTWEPWCSAVTCDDLRQAFRSSAPGVTSPREWTELAACVCVHTLECTLAAMSASMVLREGKLQPNSSAYAYMSGVARAEQEAARRVRLLKRRMVWYVRVPECAAWPCIVTMPSCDASLCVHRKQLSRTAHRIPAHWPCSRCSLLNALERDRCSACDRRTCNHSLTLHIRTVLSSCVSWSHCPLT
mgnify:CR=1 FL=1